MPRHWRVPPASGAIPPGLYPLREDWVYCLAPEAPQKGECRRGRRYFWPCRTRVGFGPATGPTLKTALCHIHALVGRNDKYRGPRGRSRAFVCGLSSPVLGLHSVGPSNLWAVLPGVSRHWRFPPASGGHPPRLIAPSGGWVYCLAPEAPQKGECRRGRRYFWPCRTRVGFGPATGPTLKTALCHIRALVGRNDKYRGPRGRSRAFVCGLSSPVLGLHSVGRLTSGRFCRACLGTGDFLRPQGATPPGLYPPLGGGWVYCLAPEAPQKGECRRGRRYFWPCRTRVGFGPETGPTLKTALCHIRALVGRNDKYRGPRGRSRAFVCGLSSPVLGLHSVGRLTSGRFCRVSRHWRFPPASGVHPPRLIAPSGGWVYCLAPEAPQKGECRRGRRYFWPCRTRVGFGPATGPTLKTALCHIRALVGRNDKYRGPRGRSRAFVCGLSSPVLGCIR